MNNNSANILEQLRQRIEDMQKELDTLKSDLETLAVYGPGDYFSGESFTEPVDISFDDMPEPFDGASEQIQEQTVDTVKTEQQHQEAESKEEESNVVEPQEAPIFEKPQKQEEPQQQKPARPAVAWRVDIPGTPVSNIISGISLNDRVLFINTLFKEDPMLFQSTINAFNSMSGLDDAIDYVMSNFPDWNINSDIVYRLMMAVRRKLK